MTKPISRPHLHKFPYTMAPVVPHRGGGRRLTFPGVVGQDGSRPHLLPLDVLAGAGLRTGRPRRPVAEHAVPGARHLTGNGLRRRGWRTETSVHPLSWETPAQSDAGKWSGTDWSWILMSVLNLRWSQVNHRLIFWQWVEMWLNHRGRVRNTWGEKPKSSPCRHWNQKNRGWKHMQFFFLVEIIVDYRPDLTSWWLRGQRASRRAAPEHVVSSTGSSGPLRCKTVLIQLRPEANDSNVVQEVWLCSAAQPAEVLHWEPTQVLVSFDWWFLVLTLQTC